MAFGNFYLDFEALKRLLTTYSWTLKLFHTNKTPKIAYHISVCSDFSSKLFLRGKTSQIQQLCTQNQMKQTNVCLLLLVFLPCVFPAFGIETIASKIRKIWSLPFASKEKKKKKQKKIFWNLVSFLCFGEGRERRWLLERGKNPPKIHQKDEIIILPVTLDAWVRGS